MAEESVELVLLSKVLGGTWLWAGVAGMTVSLGLGDRSVGLATRLYVLCLNLCRHLNLIFLLSCFSLRAESFLGVLPVRWSVGAGCCGVLLVVVAVGVAVSVRGVSGASVDVSLRFGVFSSLAAMTLDGVAILTPGYNEFKSSTSAIVGFP